MPDQVNPGVVEAIEAPAASEPFLALALLAAFVLAREALKTRRPTEA